MCYCLESTRPHEDSLPLPLRAFPSCPVPCSHADMQALSSSSGEEALGLGMLPALALECSF